MPIDDRDKQFERALARNLRNASPDSACPDAEILAAYHERTLSPEEMASWKEHIAACTRCQECLALVEQTESLPAEEFQHEDVFPSLRMDLRHTDLSADSAVRRSTELPSSVPMVHATPSSSVRSISRPRWHLLLPIGTIAAAAILWVGVREVPTQRFQQPGAAQVAENRAPLPAPSSSEAELQNQRKKQESSTLNASKESVAKKPPVALAPVLVSPPRAMAPVAAGAVHQNADNSLLDQRDATGASSTEGDAKKTDSRNMARISAAEKSAQAPPAKPAAAAASNTAAQRKDQYLTAPPPATSETVQVQSETQPLTVNGNAAQIAPNETGKMADLVKLALANRLYIVAPGEKHAWRLGNGGQIERTTDRGKTWKSQNSGVARQLTAGSATSDKVCWVVGRGGTLLLTTDGGKHWKLLSSPIKEDLGGVHATDAMHATVWDVPNRKSFETSDGGETWRPAANQ
jgi:photosynthesis system II assembly factor YCF48-like protein